MKKILTLLLIISMVTLSTSHVFALENNNMELIDANPYLRASQAPTSKYDLVNGQIKADGVINLKSSYGSKLLKTSTGKLTYTYEHTTIMTDADTIGLTVWIFEEGKDPKNIFDTSKASISTKLQSSDTATKTGFDTSKYYYFFWERAAKFDVPTDIKSTIKQ